MSTQFTRFIIAVMSVCLLGCGSTAHSVPVVKNFDANQYLGKWYEIARLDFWFERNLNNTSAEYSKLADNRIEVINRGFNYKTQKWKQAKGKAKFKNTPDEGALEVSFFGPFYSAYNIVALDKDYQYALIAGRSTDYLWLLSRTKTIPDAVKADYLKQAKALGYDVNQLIWVKHD